MELVIATALVCFLLGFGCCYLWVAIGTKVRIEDYIPAVTANVTSLSALTQGHIHEATELRTNGWYCSCGKHYHRFTVADGDVMRCMCSEPGIEDRWQLQ